MSKKTPRKVLDVGNCGPDHTIIRKMLERHFDVEIDRVMFVEDAIEQMRRSHYDLVLFNRLVFEDGSEGIELLRQAKNDADLKHVPIMMISNFDAAQSMSVASGGEPGFGNSLSDPRTVELLSNYLTSR